MEISSSCFATPWRLLFRTPEDGLGACGCTVSLARRVAVSLQDTEPAPADPVNSPVLFQGFQRHCTGILEPPGPGEDPSCGVHAQPGNELGFQNAEGQTAQVKVIVDQGGISFGLPPEDLPGFVPEGHVRSP